MLSIKIMHSLKTKNNCIIHCIFLLRILLQNYKEFITHHLFLLTSHNLSFHKNKLSDSFYKIEESTNNIDEVNMIRNNKNK